MKKIIIINIIVIFSLLLILEITFRIFNISYTQDIDNNLFYKENNITMNNTNTISRVFGKTVVTDKYGFRVPDVDYKYEHDESILVLGDSVSFGIGVDEKDSFIGFSREIINKNIYNASVMGLNITNYGELLKNYSNEFNDISKVLIFICLNDTFFNQGVIDKSEFKKIINDKERGLVSSLVKNKFLIKIDVFLRGKSALFIFIKSLVTNPYKRGFYFSFYDYSDEEKMKIFKESTKKILNVSRSKNLNTKYIVLPFAYQIDHLKCDPKYLLPQKKIKEIFKEFNESIEDLTDDFCEYNRPKTLFFDSVHLSKQGNKFVFELLQKRNILN